MSDESLLREIRDSLREGHVARDDLAKQVHAISISVAAINGRLDVQAEQMKHDREVHRQALDELDRRTGDLEGSVEDTGVHELNKLQNALADAKEAEARALAAAKAKADADEAEAKIKRAGWISIALKSAGAIALLLLGTLVSWLSEIFKTKGH